MVSYTVLNESYGTYPEPPEQFSGKLFRVFEWSHLLEFTKKTTCASDEYPGVLQHYEIACLNHVIDVICTGASQNFGANSGRAKQTQAHASITRAIAPYFQRSASPLRSPWSPRQQGR